MTRYALSIATESTDDWQPIDRETIVIDIFDTIEDAQNYASQKVVPALNHKELKELFKIDPAANWFDGPGPLSVGAYGIDMSGLITDLSWKEAKKGAMEALIWYNERVNLQSGRATGDSASGSLIIQETAGY